MCWCTNGWLGDVSDECSQSGARNSQSLPFVGTWAPVFLRRLRNGLVLYERASFAGHYGCAKCHVRFTGRFARASSDSNCGSNQLDGDCARTAEFRSISAAAVILFADGLAGKSNVDEARYGLKAWRALRCPNQIDKYRRRPCCRSGLSGSPEYRKSRQDR
jgi:hypothetical protein